MTNLDSVLKSRDITLPTKVHIVKATIFPVVMYSCVYKFNNLDEMHQLLENQKLSKLNQDEIDNPNGYITIKSFKCIVKNLPQQNLQAKSRANSTKHIRNSIKYAQSIPGHRRGRKCFN